MRNLLPAEAEAATGAAVPPHPQHGREDTGVSSTSRGRGGQASAELPRTTQDRLFSQPQPSPSGSEELLAQYG